MGTVAVFQLAFLAAVLSCAVAIGLVTYFRTLRANNLTRRRDVFRQLGLRPQHFKNKKIIGFFHPYCNAGGGGERVLWTAVAYIQRTEPDIVSVIYTGDTDANKDEIISKVKARFDITLEPSSLHFVWLQKRRLVEDATYKRFTLLGQSVGSMMLAWEAMGQLIPDLYIDTMGYAFTFHVVSLLGVPVGTYTHYPTISTTMLGRVRSRTQGHTNANFIANSVVLSSGKSLYYRLFTHTYALSFRLASFIMVNSSWTKGHIDDVLSHSDRVLDVLHSLLMLPLFFFRLSFRLLAPAPSRANAISSKANIVYPPCDTHEMAGFNLKGRERIILSIAQFRPEKDHPTAIHALHQLFKMRPHYGVKGGKQTVRLVLLGGARNEGDVERVDGLKRLARELGVQDNVEFVVNAPYPIMLSWLSRASIGLSTMVEEHFGINVVEYMAAGLIPVTHASGGPLNDIVVSVDGEPTGFHATTPATFAAALESALTLPPAEDRRMRERARARAVRRFSVPEFEKGWAGSGWRGWV